MKVEYRPLSPYENEMLDLLLGPGRYPFDPIHASPGTRHMEIPATMQIPTSPETWEAEKRRIRDAAYSDLAPGELPFNPVTEYEAYVILEGLGLVTMATEQGSGVTEVKITPEGIKRRGKKPITAK